MKKLLLISFMLFSFIMSYSQTQEKTFYLKNGSVVSGVVIEEIPGKQYKVETKDGNIFVFKADEIEKITASAAKSRVKTTRDLLPDGKFFYTVNELCLGALFVKDYSTYKIGVSSINGININNQFGFGFGVEYQQTDLGYFIPLFADARLNFSKTRNTFFTYLNGGMAISGRHEIHSWITPQGSPFDFAIKYQNGSFFRLGFGYRKELTEKLNAHASLAYTAHSYYAKKRINSFFVYEDIGTYSVVELKFGVGF